MQGSASPNGAHDLHARSLTECPLDINDLIALPHTEVDGLLYLAMQFAHGQQGGIAHIQTTFDQIAQLQQAHAKPVTACLGSIHETAAGQVVENSVGCRWVQATFFTDFFE